MLEELPENIMVRASKDGVEYVDIFTGEVVQGKLNNLPEIVDGRLKDPVTKDWSFTIALASIICSRVAEGAFLTKLCKEPGIPPYRVISLWRSQNERFALMLAQAEKDRAEYYHDQALESSMLCTDKDMVPAMKLAVDTLKWAAERGDPNRYGSKVQVQGDDSRPIVIKIDTGIKRHGDDHSVKEVVSSHLQALPILDKNKKEIG
jgi:hypothetical protein